MLQLDYVVLLPLQVLEDVLTSLLVLLLEGRVRQGQLSILRTTLVLLIPLELSPLSCLMHDAEVDLALIGVAEGLMGLFDGVPGVFRTRVLALIRMQDHSESLVLLLDLILSGNRFELQHVVRIVELLISEAVDLDIGLESFSLDGLVFDSVDLPRVVRDLLTSLILLLHSLLNIIYTEISYHSWLDDAQVTPPPGDLLLRAVALHTGKFELILVEGTVILWGPHEVVQAGCQVVVQ